MFSRSVSLREIPSQSAIRRVRNLLKCQGRLRWVGHLAAIFRATPGTPGGIVALDGAKRSTTFLLTRSDPPSYLLVLGLTVTAIIAVVVFYFVVRRQRRALFAGRQKDAPVMTSPGTSLFV